MGILIGGHARRDRSDRIHAAPDGERIART